MTMRDSVVKSCCCPARRLDVDIDFLLAAPATNLVLDLLLCIPLDHTGEADRGILGSVESP